MRSHHCTQTRDKIAPKVPRAILKDFSRDAFSSGFALCPAHGFGVFIRTQPAAVVKFKLPLVPDRLPFSVFTPAEFPAMFEPGEGQAACTTPTSVLDPFLIVTHASQHYTHIINMRTKERVGSVIVRCALKRPGLVASQGCWTAICFGSNGDKVALFQGAGNCWHQIRVIDVFRGYRTAITAIALDARGEYLAMLRQSSTVVRQFEVLTGAQLPFLNVPSGFPSDCAYGEDTLMVACHASTNVIEFGEEATLVKNSGGEGDSLINVGMGRDLRVLPTGQAILRGRDGTTMWLLETEETNRKNTMSPLRVGWMIAVCRGVARRRVAAAAAATAAASKRLRTVSAT